MTRETQTDELDCVIVSDKESAFMDRAMVVLSKDDCEALSLYIDSGGKELALSTANKFFELFISGSDSYEIQRLNPAFDLEVIQWCQVKYDWNRLKDEFFVRYQKQVMDKILKAHFDAASLYSDMITVACKKYADSFKKYIQTGDDKYLEGTMEITTVHQLQKAVEGLQKVTGQDKNIQIIGGLPGVGMKQVGNEPPTEDTSAGKSMTTQTASRILAMVAESKRESDLEKK